MPACKKCNEKYGKIEYDLLVRFGLCLDRTQEGAKGIPEKALRSINPKAGKNIKDSYHRQKIRQKTLREALMANEIPKTAILPGFGLHPSQDFADVIGITVGVNELEALGEKLVRGITYVSSGRYIEEDHEIKIYFDPNQGAAFAELVEKYGTKHHRGPGISVSYAAAEDDPVSGVFDFTLWGTYRFWAAVNPSKGRNIST
ncbi:MAG: hypothetical protein JRF41_12155 [Deltaproteobacteria bacterium]|nr:hypothetical protein [Deltaproteobacteria bacterium]